MMSSRVLVITALAGLPMAIAAQRPSDVAERTTGVVRASEPINLVRTPAADRATARATLERILEIVRRNPALNPPVGFDVRHTLMAYAPIGATAARPPLAYRVNGLIHWQNPQGADGRIGPSPVAMNEYSIVANDLTVFWVPQDLYRKTGDRGRWLYWEPVRSGEVHGFPYYEQSRVVITKSARPIYIPVSRERLLQFELEDHRATLRKLHPQAAAELRQQTEGCIAEVERTLAILDAAQRAEPGYLSLTPPSGRRGPRCSLMVDASAMHARRIVEENPDLYDPALPRTAIQIIVAQYLRPLRGQRENRYLRHFAALREGMEHGAFAELLAKR